MSASTDAGRYVELRGGLIVPAAALQLAWSLEAKGVRLLVEADGVLAAEPRAALTAEDCVAIRRHRHHLRALIHYGDTEGWRKT